MAQNKEQAKKIFIKVVTPEETVFEGYVDFISIPAKSGSLGVLPHHVPIIAQLKIGILKLLNEGNYTYIGVCRGYFEFLENKANVITEKAIITTPEKKEETLHQLKTKHDITQEITDETKKVIQALAALKNLRR